MLGVFLRILYVLLVLGLKQLYIPMAYSAILFVLNQCIPYVGTGRLLLFELKEQSEEASADSFQCSPHFFGAYSILLSHDCYLVYLYEGCDSDDPPTARGGIQFSDE